MSLESGYKNMGRFSKYVINQPSMHVHNGRADVSTIIKRRSHAIRNRYKAKVH